MSTNSRFFNEKGRLVPFFFASPGDSNYKIQPAGGRLGDGEGPIATLQLFSIRRKVGNESLPVYSPKEKTPLPMYPRRKTLTHNNVSGRYPFGYLLFYLLDKNFTESNTDFTKS